MKPEVRLENLLLSIFTPDELVRWLRNFSDENLVDEILIGGIAPMYAIHNTIQALKRRGLINEALFEGLITERPGRSADIRLVSKWWLNHPKHFLLSPYRFYVTDGNAHRSNTFSFPGSCVCITLPNASESHAQGNINAAIFDYESYRLIPKLLDTLYVDYIMNLFSPLSYGHEWLLRLGSRALVPWEWLGSAMRGQLASTPRRWLATQDLAHAGIAPGTVLSVVDLRHAHFKDRDKFFGIAVNHDQIRTIFDFNMKALLFMNEDLLLRDTPPDSVNLDVYPYTGVYFTFGPFKHAAPKSGAWTQAREPTKVELEHWNYLVKDK